MAKSDDRYELSGDSTEMSVDNVHNKPVEVERAPGGGVSEIVIRELFKDGSKHTNHFTREQAEKIRDRLNEIL